MFKKCLALFFIGIAAVGADRQAVYAQPGAADTVKKIKAEVISRGTGSSAKVTVRLKNGAKLKGYISQAIEDSFDLTDPQTRGFITIPYVDVRSIKNQGLSKNMKILVVAGVIAAVTAMILTSPGASALPVFCPLGC